MLLSMRFLVEWLYIGPIVCSTISKRYFMFTDVPLSISIGWPSFVVQSLPFSS